MYFVYLHAVPAVLDNLAGQLEQRINREGIVEKVSILKYPVKFMDHGQNPLGDDDGRPWMSVKNPDNEEIFQPKQPMPEKFIVRDAAEVFDKVARLIRTDTYRAIV